MPGISEESRVRSVLPPRPTGKHPRRGIGLNDRMPLLAGDKDAVAKADELASLKPDSLNVLVDIVNKCNLRCIMCHFTFDDVFYQRSQLMVPKTFAKIAASIRPYTRRLTLSAAYEPTVSPHFKEILGIAGSYGFPEISFLTNGNSMPQGLIETIVASGVTEVCFSVHAARSDTYAHILRGGRLDRARSNIERLIRVRDASGKSMPRIQLNIALMRSNIEELTEIIELAAELGVNSVAFRHLIVFDGLEMESESLAPHDRRLVNAYIQLALERAQLLGVPIYNSPDYFEIPGCDVGTQWTDWRSGPTDPGPPITGDETATRLDRSRPLPTPPLARRTGAKPKRRSPWWAWARWSARPSGHKIPIGSVDSPADNPQFYGDAMEIVGWALGPTGITQLRIVRDPVPEDPAAAIEEDGFVRIGSATFHNATRPDVVRAFPQAAFAYRAGWTFVLKRTYIPKTSQPHLVLRAIAVDRNGSVSVVGTRTLWLRGGSGEKAFFIRCGKPFDSLYIDARAHVYPYPDCHTDNPFGEHHGQPFEEVWNDLRLVGLRRALAAGRPPEMCHRCPLFINRDVNMDDTFLPHEDFSTEERR